MNCKKTRYHFSHTVEQSRLRIPIWNLSRQRFVQYELPQVCSWSASSDTLRCWPGLRRQISQLRLAGSDDTLLQSRSRNWLQVPRSFASSFPVSQILAISQVTMCTNLRKLKKFSRNFLRMFELTLKKCFKVWEGFWINFENLEDTWNLNTLSAEREVLIS